MSSPPPWPPSPGPYLTSPRRVQGSPPDEPNPRPPNTQNIFFYPFLTGITALREGDATRQAISLDVVAEAFDAESDQPIEHAFDTTMPPVGPVPTDGPDRGEAPDDDEFVAQLRKRMEQLGDRTLETRELSRHQENLCTLRDKLPNTDAMKEWAHQVAHTMRRACCAVESLDRRAVDDDADAVIREIKDASEHVSEAVQSALSRLAAVEERVADKMTSNYEWVRSQSTLLGLQCATSTRCPVCLVNQVSMFVDPCGHTFCRNCMDKCGDNECCVCRGSIRSKRKLFWCG